MASEVNNFMVITNPQQETHHGFSIEQYRKKTSLPHLHSLYNASSHNKQMCTRFKKYIK